MSEEAQLKTVVFRCRSCKQTFEAAPARIEDTPEDDIHPWRYYHPCKCGEEAPQAWWQRSAMKAWRNATGPRTPEGKAAVTENLKGHPTPEEARRTRFNGMKHGLNARVATYFPAKPDGYSFCSACDVDREWCREQPCCEKQTILFMKHRAAFEQRNPKHLMGIYADFHSALMSTVMECLRRIIGDGVTINSPKTYVDKEGSCLVVEYLNEQGRRQIVTEIQAHPLFRPMSELITRMGISLSDLAMTPRQMEEEPGDMGALAGGNAESMDDFSQRQAKALEDLRGHLSMANVQREKDPVLLEYKRQNGDGNAGL